jgi:uncharacterized protein
VLKRLVDLQYRFYDRIRHRDAFRAAEVAGSAPDIDALRGRHYCLLVTIKRSGEAVPTPVLFGLADGKLYARTEPRVAKVKRIRNNPRVLVGPSNLRGKPLGPMTEGTARVLPPAENERAYAALKANYTVSQRLYESAIDRLGVELVYVEVTPVVTAAPEAAPVGAEALA